MRYWLVIGSFLAVRAFAQTGGIEGVVKDQAGQPVAGTTVAATLFTSDELQDAGPTQRSDGEGKFRFEHLGAGKYSVTATSPSVAAGAVMTTVADGAMQSVTIRIGGPVRVISGSVSGARNARVIGGRPSGQEADIFVAPVTNGRYAIAIAPGPFSLRAVAPDGISPYTIAKEQGDLVQDLKLEHVFKSAPPAVAPWLKAHAIALNSATAGSGFDDMRRIRDIVGSAHLVALGEATHGTREFFQLKHRILEYLVAQMGFDVFAIEASFPDALAVNQYVLTGEGDPAAALAGLGFWTWNTEEVLDMIRWMRAWNADPQHVRKVRFYGFDMQSPFGAIRLIRKYAKAHSDDATLSLLDKIVRLKFGPGPMPEAQTRLAEELLDDVAKRLDANRTVDRDWLLARQAVELLRQAANNRSSSDRDRAMANNIEWLMQHEPAGSKMVIWAHNGHVATEIYPFAPEGTMGAHLKKAFGDDLVVFGFVFNRGGFQAMSNKGLTDHVAQPLAPGAFDRTLADAGAPMLVVDLRKSSGDVRRWLDSPLPHRSVGAMYNDARPGGYEMTIHPLRSFDAIVFVENTTAAKAVRGPRPPASSIAPAAVNLNFDDGIAGWSLVAASRKAGYTVAATAEGCVHGGCAVLTHGGEIDGYGFGSFMQLIDATAYRGKTIRLRAKMKSVLEGEGASARIWLRVDKGDGRIGFFDNMSSRAPKSLPEWTDMEITGNVADDAAAIAFGVLFLGDGTAWIDEGSLEIVP
jgi:erythromycin esterase